MDNFSLKQEKNDIYNYIKSIGKRDLFLYISIIIFSIYIFKNVNIKIGSMIGLGLALLFVYFVNEKTNFEQKSEIKNYEKKLNSIFPKPREISKYPEIIEFIYSIREFYDYNWYAFTKMVKNIESFIQLYQDINNGLRHCKHNYELANSKKNNALNNLHSIIITLEVSNNRVLSKKMKNALDYLQKLLNKYIQEIIIICKEQNEKKLTNESGIINYDMPIPYKKFQNPFIKNNKRFGQFTYKIY